LVTVNVKATRIFDVTEKARIYHMLAQIEFIVFFDHSILR